MNPITIPKSSFGQGDLVVVSRTEYESLKARALPEYTPTIVEKRAIARARRNFHAGKTISLAQLECELANRD